MLEDAVAMPCDDGAPYRRLSGEVRVPLVFLGEHAGNAVPAEYDDLGLHATDLSSHWAYDPGILGVLLATQRAVHCPGLHGRYSRLLVDLNRTPSSPQLARPAIGAGGPGDPIRPVPGNQDLSVQERRRRLHEFYRPYHRAATELTDDAVAHHGSRILVVSFHSFTPRFAHEDRRFDVGLLFGDDGEIADRVRERLETSGLRVRHNEPYSGLRGENFSPRIHAEIAGARHLEVEVNQASIAGEREQAAIGAHLATALRHVLVHL